MNQLEDLKERLARAKECGDLRGVIAINRKIDEVKRAAQENAVDLAAKALGIA